MSTGGLFGIIFLVNILAVPSFGTLIQKFVKRGEEVRLECNVQKASTPVVTWSDNIFTSDSAIDIYTLDRSGSKKNNDHPRIDSFVLDPSTLALSITKMDDDFVGSYTCSSKVGNDIHNISYSLAAYSPLNCSKVANTYKTNQIFEYKCTIEFSGRSPALSMLKDGRRLDETEAILSDDIDFLSYEYKHVLTPEDDGKNIGCRAEMDDIKEECNTILNVTYLTRSASFEPTASNLSVGENVMCKADGNPTPDLIIHKDGKDEVIHKGKGMVSIEILPEWQDTAVRLHCLAENEPGHPISRHKTIHVFGPKSGELTSSSEGRMSSVVFVLNVVMVILLSFILH